ncbi:hypothetical protein HDU79_007289 [Rhizoclosmatium sp. JEL0117]|nr:hypothetical protein HDU79_007289 [Rhizoclosmatium sp. JEL0117]
MNCLQVRGIAKQQAKERNAKKQASVGTPNSQLEARAKGLTIICPICRTQVGSYKLIAGHYEAKHPKEPIPPESSFAK